MLKIKNHSKLNPILWNSDNSIHPEVAEVLTRISVSFMTVLSTYVGLPLDFESDVLDVFVAGSSVEYFYDKNSDIDLTLLIKADRYLERMKPDIFDGLVKFIQNFFIEK